MASSSTNQFFTSSTPADHPENGTTSFSSLQQKAFIQNLDSKAIEEFFEVAETVEWINSNSFKRIALQFPDSFLPSARIISNLIETKTSSKTFVLADTSYRSCCIDEVAAAHASCDAIIHYGEACLSIPTNNISVKYVLGKMPINIDDFKKNVESKLPSFESPNVVLLTDSIYAHHEALLLETVRSSLGSSKSIECAFLDSSLSQQNDEKKATYLGRCIPSCLTQKQPTDLLFCGVSESSLLPLWLLSWPSCINLMHYDPANMTLEHESTRSSRLLRKRLFLVEKLKDANTVGLVVGSVGVDKHKDAVLRMRSLCKTAGKKLYVISVGKINVPKLSNFSSDIDVFVLLSCPFGVLLDSSEFYRPVLSFFEAEIALNPAKSWAADGGWSAEFANCLNEEITEDDRNEDEKSDFSLISGKVRTQHKKENENGTTSTVALYTAGDYFGERSWKGLDDGIRVEEETKVHEGRSGIAQGYEGK